MLGIVPTPERLKSFVIPSGCKDRVSKLVFKRIDGIQKPYLCALPSTCS